MMMALALLCAACLGGGQTAPAKTTITYTRDAAKLVNLWVDNSQFVVLGGSKAPKFTGSAVSSAIIHWDPDYGHYMAGSAAVLTTGDAKWAISKVPYKGGDVKPSYPNIVNSNIKVGALVATLQ
jgi:hypothetical protein